jgi:hypothetical protein
MDYNGTLAINDKGTVAATVVIFPAAGGEEFGVALNGNIHDGRVAWPGGIINGCVVYRAIAGGINSAGQIAMYVACSKDDNNVEAIIIATPKG